MSSAHPRRSQSIAPRLLLALGLVAVSLLNVGLGAQRTWIVDAKNGAGTNFTDLPAAFAAVADGDIVLVRSGRYKPGTLSKAIRLLAEPGSFVGIAAADFTVSGIGAGKSCVIRGLTFDDGNSFITRFSVRINDNDGLVVLDHVVVAIARGSRGLYVKRSKGVSILDASVRPQLIVEESELTAARSLFAPYQNGPVTAGIFGYKARIELTQCVALGFNGGGHAPSTWAIRCSLTELIIRGDALSRFIGGTYNGVPASPSIDGWGTTTLLVDPAVVLSPPPKGISTLTRRQLPAIHTFGGQLGGKLDLVFRSKAGDPFVVGLALPTVPFDLPFGRQWLDLSTEIFLVIARQGGSGSSQYRFNVPTSPSFRGLTLGIQALSGRGAGLELSNAEFPILH